MIIPSIVIKNCLPVKLYFTLLDQPEQQIVTLEKGQEQHLSVFNENTIWGEVWIDGFERSKVKVEFVETNSEDKLVLAQSSDKQFKLDLYIQKNDSAGCHMTFYVKTVFINQTGLENLEFFSFDTDRATLIPQ